MISTAVHFVPWGKRPNRMRSIMPSKLISILVRRYARHEKSS
jgi:hypothetical protein